MQLPDSDPLHHSVMAKSSQANATGKAPDSGTPVPPHMATPGVTSPHAATPRPLTATSVESTSAVHKASDWPQTVRDRVRVSVRVRARVT